MKGFRPGGRRKSGAERAEIGGNLPRGHPCHAFQRPKKPGKTGRYAEEIGCEIGKLSDRENRRRCYDRDGAVSNNPYGATDGLTSDSHSTLITTAVMSSAWRSRQNMRASRMRCSMITLGSSRRWRRTTSIARSAPNKL